MNRLITLTYQFYRPILLWNLIFTGLGLFFIYYYGVGTIGNSLMIKLTGYGSAFGYQYFMANKSYFYFRNAGYSVRRMYTYTFLADLLLYFILVTLYANLFDGTAHFKG